MIKRNFLCSQHSMDAVNLLQLSIAGIYEIIHNTFIIGWIIGILFGVFCLIVKIKLSKATSKVFISNPSREFFWLIIPVFILIFLSIPTLLRLYQMDLQHLHSKISLKTIGIQWYWSYEVIDNYQSKDDNTVNRYIDGTNNDRLNYLSREQELHLPGNTEIINIISASDVIHCWAIPNLILKVDAIPGRVNHISIYFERCDGLRKLYGQCSELCGANHRFMPISVVAS